jgi:preprotein translocase subunit SecF
MEFFKHNTKIDFMGARKWTTAFSVIMILGSILAVAIFRINWGLDYTGGTQLEVAYSQPVDLPALRQQLAEAGFREAVVQSYGSSETALISIGPRKDLAAQQLRDKLQQALPGAAIKRIEYVGPQVGEELATKGVLAIVISMLAILIYVAIRFEYRFGISAILALVHDPLVILGVFALFHIEFNLPALAALLTVIGYSLNDTIVVFDRVRENFRKMRKFSPVEIMNISINQTLSRTIMTSGLTLLVVIALLIYGGELLRSFSIALVIGIVVGTYSSIYIAGVLAVAMGLNRNDFLPKETKAVDDMP